MPWPQRYDPFESPVLSTLVALAPVVLLLGLLATRRVRTEWAAVVGLAASKLHAMFMD
jgi:lactate permease